MSAVKKQEVITFGRAIGSFFRKYFQFSGTASRAEFWWAFLFLIICFLGCIVITGGIAAVLRFVDPLIIPWDILIFIIFPLLSLWYVATVIPLYAILSRRFHDAGFSAKWLWLSAVPQLICLILLFYCVVFGGLIYTIYAFLWSISLWVGIIWPVLMLVWLGLCTSPSKIKDNPYRD